MTDSRSVGYKVAPVWKWQKCLFCWETLGVLSNSGLPTTLDSSRVTLAWSVHLTMYLTFRFPPPPYPSLRLSVSPSILSSACVSVANTEHLVKCTRKWPRGSCMKWAHVYAQLHSDHYGNILMPFIWFPCFIHTGLKSDTLSGSSIWQNAWLKKKAMAFINILFIQKHSAIRLHCTS